MLSDRCLWIMSVLSCLALFDVGVFWPNGWMDQDETWYGGIDLGPGHIVLDEDPAPKAPIFGPCLLWRNAAGWIKMPLGREGDSVLDGDLAPLFQRSIAPQFSVHVYCGHWPNGRPYFSYC